MSDLREELQKTLGAAYSLERELGGGGMSRVFLAEEAALGRKVVVKVVPPELAAGVNVDRFRREIQVSAKLQHPHIVPVLSTGETGGVPYYTMPFVEGESLRSRLAKTGPLPIADAVSVLRDTAKALAYAHERGVVHRDIKPDNILLMGASATVADFGIAKAISAARTDVPNATLTQVGTSIGTPAYMAPEQAAGDPSTDHHADLYSFGCMAYETLTGRPPFTASSPHKLLAAHMAAAPEQVALLRPDVPASLAALVMQCLEKDPEKRPANATEVVAALDNVTSAGHTAMPAILLGGPGMFRKALGVYAAAFVVVAIVAQAAIIATGLPDWVFSGSLIVMALGLPVILFTGYVHHTTRRMVTMTPKLTPGGSPRMPQGTMQTLAMKASPHMSWKRTTIAGVYALGAFILLVGGFMLLRSMGIGPVGSLLAAGKLTSREPLLVTDFTVRNADTTLGRVLSDAAQTQLAQSSVITLMSPQGVADALQRMQRPANSKLDLPLARDLALREGIRAIVDGDITGLGAGGYIVTMKLVTTDSAKELASFRETAASAPDLIEAVDALARKLRGKVGESLKRVREAPNLARATTSSLEALKKFTEGARLEQQTTRRQEAIALLQEAVNIDTAFAEGWRKLAIVMGNAGRPRAQIDSAYTQAYRFRDRVPENARNMIVAGYYNSGPGRDRGKAVAAYEEILRSGDTLGGVANNLALILSQRREFARAESLYRAQIRLDPKMFRTTFLNLIITQLRQQKLAAADSTVALAVSHFADLELETGRGAIDNLFRTGDTAAFRRVIDSMFTSGDSSAKAWARSRVQNLALLDGRASRWRSMVNELRPATPNPRQRLNIALQQVDNEISVDWLNRPNEVVRRLDEALAGFRGPLSPTDYLNIAGLYAYGLRPDKARPYLARFDAEVRDTALKRQMAPAIANATADVLVAEGKGLEAVDLYRRGDRLPDGPASACLVCLPLSLAYAFDKAGVVDSAIKYHEAYVATFDINRFGMDPRYLALTSKRLGELYEQKGNPEKAAKYYTDFVNLWKNADPELQPQVAEVRRKLSRLADIERR